MITYWTGNFCALPGMYESDCDCAHVIELRRGEEFPPCAECSELVSWQLLARPAEESEAARR